MGSRKHHWTRVRYDWGIWVTTSPLTGSKRYFVRLRVPSRRCSDGGSNFACNTFPFTDEGLIDAYLYREAICRAYGRVHRPMQGTDDLVRAHQRRVREAALARISEQLERAALSTELFTVSTFRAPLAGVDRSAASLC